MCKREERPLFQGVTYSVEEENPDQIVFLNDLKVPRDLGEKGSVLVGRRRPLSLTVHTETAKELPLLEENHPQHVSQLKSPVPVSSRWMWRVHRPPVSSRMMGWTEVQPWQDGNAREAGPSTGFPSPKVWYVCLPLGEEVVRVKLRAICRGEGALPLLPFLYQFRGNVRKLCTPD